MAVLQRFTKQQIKSQFTHYGWFWGCVPVYVNMANPGMGDVATRNWIPEWTLDAVEWIGERTIRLVQIVNPCFAPEVAIKLTGFIEARE